MPNYGDATYWDERYREVDSDGDGEESMSSPFDWLFSYEDVRSIVTTLLPDRKVPAFLVGCGNAPFSIDMYNDGYHNIRNSDYSEVVIRQQSKKFPHMTWELIDAMDSKFPTNSVECIVDKSLIDTILCYPNSLDKMKVYMYEMFRILKPGGRFITWSLHPIHEVFDHFDPVKFDWKIRAYNVKSPRWQKNKENRHKSVAHSMIVCDKHGSDVTFPPIDDVHASLFDKGALTDDEYNSFRKLAADFNEKFVLDNASTKQLIKVLDRSLAMKLEETSTNFEKEYFPSNNEDKYEESDVDDDETTNEDTKGNEIIDTIDDDDDPSMHNID